MEMIPNGQDVSDMIALAQATRQAELAAFLLPVLALVIWTLVMWVWMYLTRIPAMNRHGVKPQDAAMKNAPGMLSLPPKVRQVADNYNHLHEQPTLFYALAIHLALTGADGQIAYWLCWAYVGFRVVHSLIQATVNIVRFRFLTFTLGTFCLIGLAGIAVGRMLG